MDTWHTGFLLPTHSPTHNAGCLNGDPHTLLLSHPEIYPPTNSPKYIASHPLTLPPTLYPTDLSKPLYSQWDISQRLKKTSHTRLPTLAPFTKGVFAQGSIAVRSRLLLTEPGGRGAPCACLFGFAQKCGENQFIFFAELNVLRKIKILCL